MVVVDVPANGEVFAASSLVFDGSASDDVGVDAGGVGGV